MPSVKVFDMAGKENGVLELSDVVFGIKPNKAVLHAAVRAFLLNQRQGTQSTLTRSEVRGGGKKPWRQKGTGRARHGSTRSPQWTHGGVALGPKPRKWKIALNKKVGKLALKSALSSKVLADELIVVESISLPGYKTKAVTSMIGALGGAKKALIVTDSYDEVLIKSASNIPGVKTALTNTLNVYDILNCDKLIVSKGAVGKIEEVYA